MRLPPCGREGAVVSKQQLSGEFLDGFRVCEETPKIEETAVCSETDVDAVWQVLFCLTEHDAERAETVSYTHLTLPTRRTV